MEKVLSGKPVATAINQRIKDALAMHDIRPQMALIRLGDDPASAFYVQNIIRQGGKLGCEIHLIDLPETTSQQQLLQAIRQYNEDDFTHGIMIQKPLPKHIDSTVIDNAVDAEKDIDGINPVNLGRLFLEQTCFAPCTAQAVIEILKHYEIRTTGKEIVILGRSAVVGKPLAGLLLNKSNYGNATVTVCHSKTLNLAQVISQAEILIAAIGKANFVVPEMLSPDTICIDVGINAITDPVNGDIYVGDIDYNACFGKALAITPVPGGVGSVTTSLLLENLVLAAIRQKVDKNY